MSASAWVWFGTVTALSEDRGITVEFEDGHVLDILPGDFIGTPVYGSPVRYELVEGQPKATVLPDQGSPEQRDTLELILSRF